MAHRIVLIGAGSAQFGSGTLTDIFLSDVLKGSHIVLHDINPTSLAKMLEVGQAYIQEKALPFTLSATTDRREALRGADFCIISIEVGNRFELWEQDWNVALQYGIRQVYGENGGPGGLFHSLRIIPPILEICGDIMAICPEAHVFSFSNPMSRICTTVKRKYPDLRFVGLCHEIASLPAHLPKILGLPFDQLLVRAAGLNHFSFMLECRRRDTGDDLYPVVREKAPAYFARVPTLARMVQRFRQEGRAEELERLALRLGTEPLVADEWHERGLFRTILDKFGYLPITSDSHTGEYIQWAHEVSDHEGILAFYQLYKAWCGGHHPQIGERVSERVVPLIDGIITNAGFEEMAVNLLNEGYITNLPSTQVVEVPAIVDGTGIHGLKLGEMPKGLAGLLLNQVAVHDLTAEAVLTGSRAAALQALLVDPVVTSVRAAEQTLDTMLTLQARYLSYIK